MENWKSESESESEKGEIAEESDFEMENLDRRKERVQANQHKPQDELKLHTDGEMPTGENENKYSQTGKTFGYDN